MSQKKGLQLFVAYRLIFMFDYLPRAEIMSWRSLWIAITCVVTRTCVGPVSV